MDEDRQTGSFLCIDTIPLAHIPDPSIPQAASHYPLENYHKRSLILHEKKLPLYVATALTVYAFFVLGMSGAWRPGVLGVTLAIERSTYSALLYAALSGERIQSTVLSASLHIGTQTALLLDVPLNILRALWDTISSFARMSIDLIRHNWGSFVSGNSATEQLPPLDRAALKAELKKELLREMTATSVGQHQGIVVTKSNGDPATDAVTVKNIQEAFSDDVTVELDASGKSGIIRPVFLSGKIQEYLYIMVPLER